MCEDYSKNNWKSILEEEDERILNELDKIASILPCPECCEHKPGWPDTWRNKPGYSGTQYICWDCYTKLGGK